MRKVPIFTLIAALFLAGGYFIYQHASSKVELTFNFLVEKKAENNTVVGTIDGAGKKAVTLSLSKEKWQKVKKGDHYFVEASFYNKKHPSNAEKKTLKGPFWTSETNQGILSNSIKIKNMEPITD